MDKWTKREMLTMELGGNQNAREYLKKMGKESFEGYKGDLARKYVAQLSKKVEAALENQSADEEPENSTPKEQPVLKKEDVLPKKSVPEDIKKEEDTPTNTIDKSQMKSKKFAVTFTPK